MSPERVLEIQRAVQLEQFDAWLFYDFRGSDPIGRRILGLGAEFATRRWFYLVPVAGMSRKLVSAVEPHALADLPGSTIVYRTWQEMQEGLRSTLSGMRNIAMQFSPNNAVPYVARVDAGTIDLIRSFGVHVGSAGDLIQRFEAVWSAEQLASHHRAADVLHEAVHAAFEEIGRRVSGGRQCTESLIQQFLLERFAQRGMQTGHPPIVAVGAHSADPHYSPPAAGGSPIDRDDFVLIDLWVKEPEGVYADITWTAWVGDSPPSQHRKVFDLVRKARDAGVEHVRTSLASAAVLRGCDVDATVRAVIVDGGCGEFFVHRTGHSIGTEVHGNGANIDGFETPDDRRLLSHTCFSIEPGVYLPGKFGVRSEIDVYINETEAIVTGGSPQTEIVSIFGKGTGLS